MNLKNPLWNFIGHAPHFEKKKTKNTCFQLKKKKICLMQIHIAGCVPALHVLPSIHTNLQRSPVKCLPLCYVVTRDENTLQEFKSATSSSSYNLYTLDARAE